MVISLPYRKFFKFSIYSISLFFFSNIHPIEGKDYNKNNNNYFEYIYIDSNSGQSSGGHSAIKFGNWIYHFQYYPDKIFRIVRESWFDFRFSYNIQGNRTLDITKVYPQGIETSFFEKGFNKLYLIQEKHLNNWKELREDSKLLHSQINPSIENGVPGLGYFSKTRKNSSVQNLKNKILSKYGNDIFAITYNKFFKDIQNLNWKPNTLTEDKFNHENYPLGLKTLSSKYNSKMQKLGLIEAIDKNKSLNPLSLIEFPPGYIDPMTPSEELALKKLSVQLEERILTNIPDEKNSNSYINLLDYITYLTILECLERKKFVFLDTFTEYRNRVSWNHKDELNPLNKETLLLFQKVRAHVFSKKFDLQEFVDLQDSANRVIEISRSKKGLRAIRYIHTKTLPMKSGMPTSYPTLPWNYSTLNKYFLASKEIEREYKKNLESLYPYQLILQNCTSEIFFSFDKFVKGDKKKIESTLGKHIDPLKSLSFIPFYASYDIKRNYLQTENYKYLSYRRSKIQELKKIPDQILFLDFRESLVPTSTLYKTNSEDHVFLFFTDDTIFLRPIYGLGNLIVGLGTGLVGIPLSPFDRGKTVMNGVKGVFFSFPELVFFNINKGSFLHLRLKDIHPNFPNERIENTEKDRE